MNNTILNIIKKYGDSSIMNLGESPMKIPRLKTGFVGLDRALGGGMPRGRVIEIFGPESSGKTTLCQHIISAAQKEGGNCAIIDMEHSLDPRYAEVCGVDLKSIWYAQPNSGEEALEIAEDLVEGNFPVVMVDSVSALVPRAEIEGEMGDTHVGLQARLMSQAMRKITGKLKNSDTILIFTNQLRSKIGTFYGNPNVTSGGNALKFYSSIRLELRRTQTLKSDNKPYGEIIRVVVKKNKTAPPLEEWKMTSLFGSGFSKEADLIALGLEMGIVTQARSYYKFSEYKAQGNKNMIALLSSNQAAYEELYNLCTQ